MITGFWRGLIRHWRDVFVQLDFAWAVGSGMVVAIVPGGHLVEDRFATVLATEAGIGAGLLGLVLAGLALVISFLNDDIMLLMDSEGEGLAEDVWPFSFTATLSAVCTIVAVVALAIASNTDERWMRLGLGVATFLFVWTLFCVLALVRSVHEYGRVRVEHAKGRSNQSGDGG